MSEKGILTEKFTMNQCEKVQRGISPGLGAPESGISNSRLKMRLF